MNILTMSWSMASASCFVFAFLFLFIWLKNRKNKYYIFFILAAVGAGLSALTELSAMLSTDSEFYGEVMIWQNLSIFILLVSLVWFIDTYFLTARRWLTVTITLLWSLAMGINMFSPYSLTYSKISEIRRILLPWGEYFSVPVATLNPWRYIADFASILIVFFLIDASLRLWRKSGKQRALVVGGSTVTFIIIAGIHTPLVDAGIIASPYAISFAFLAIIIAMGLQLSDDVVNSAFYSEEIKRNEKRWRTLLDNVQLMVVGLDNNATINYVNPYFLKVTGYPESEILNKDYFSLFLKHGNLVTMKQVFENIPQFTVYQNSIMTKEGSERIISWSNVQLFDMQDQKSGLLSIGSDITDREKAFVEIQGLKERLEEENIYLQEEIISDDTGREIIGSSAAIKYVINRAAQVAPTEMTVLIEGETGVGKEIIARLVHRESLRKDQLLVTVNCAAIPANMIESEMFGHVKGAFTGASRDRAGRFEVADGGTIFLDEIAELSLELQAKLLRVLEEGEYERLGSDKTVKVNVRIIAATNRILSEEVERGNFREDLFYRISAFPISIPPLRKRSEDIPLFVENFVAEFSKKYRKSITQITRTTLEKLQEYNWPGNIRELRHVIERAVIASQSDKLVLQDFTTLNNAKAKDNGSEDMLTLEQVERQHIVHALMECNGKISGENGAARLLGLHPNTLRFRMQKLNINLKSF
ncbi:MAG: sigma 54-interacting transcriptional regulator [bacterium]|nr:MAG: sigma 54-interacting transcriptional regulator [bacterium]